MALKLLKLQIMSDLHTEFLSYKKLPAIKPMAPHLALLGDIGCMKSPDLHTYNAFLEDVSKKFQTVLLLMGNHGSLRF